jgi:hypothetical protein
MTNNKNILRNFNYTHWNINSWKTDIVQNLVVLTYLLPRKTYISRHFCLKTVNNSENQLCKLLIF